VNSSLSIISQASKLLAEASTVQEAKELKSKFLVIAEWAKQMKMGEEAEQKARAYALRAIRRMGEMLRETPKAKGGENYHKIPTGTKPVPVPPTLAEMKITKQESAEAQKLADVTVQKFEKALETAKTAQEVLRFAAGAHVSNNSGDNEWYTPKEYIEAAREILGVIDLDPASTEEANGIVKATKFYTEAENGLTKKWWEGNVWMNPPYAGELIGGFADKLVTEYAADNVKSAIVLVNNATETKWFQRMARKASAICFPAGRIRFWHPRKDSATPLQGQAILYLGPNGKSFCLRFSSFGLTCIVE